MDTKKRQNVIDSSYIVGIHAEMLAAKNIINIKKRPIPEYMLNECGVWRLRFSSRTCGTPRVCIVYVYIPNIANTVTGKIAPLVNISSGCVATNSTK